MELNLTKYQYQEATLGVSVSIVLIKKIDPKAWVVLSYQLYKIKYS
jgi:hypothetical protein